MYQQEHDFISNMTSKAEKSRNRNKFPLPRGVLWILAIDHSPTKHGTHVRPLHSAIFTSRILTTGLAQKSLEALFYFSEFNTSAGWENKKSNAICPDISDIIIIMRCHIVF